MRRAPAHFAPRPSRPAANGRGVFHEHFLRHSVGTRVVAARQQVLPEHHGDPAGRQEDAEFVLDDVAACQPASIFSCRLSGSFRLRKCGHIGLSSRWVAT